MKNLNYIVKIFFVITLFFFIIFFVGVVLLYSQILENPEIIGEFFGKILNGYNQSNK